MGTSPSAKATLAIIGLGYVGLPLAVAFARRHRVIGYDRSGRRVSEIAQGLDSSGEVSGEELRGVLRAGALEPTDQAERLGEADIIIIAVPTPVDHAHVPDFAPLLGASEVAGRFMKSGAIVVYESTVYPGATEEICVPVLERESGRKWREGFFVGYSPERINPGDKARRLGDITKIVSGDTPQTCETLAQLYGEVVQAGIYRAPSIRVAEAAKVIENTQRDLNIALMNELAIICHRLGIDTGEVLAAAATKWNFLPFKPGLVGGHCIGVDPYYLTHKADQMGYHPQVILAGRRINDGMGKFIAEECVKAMLRAGVPMRGAAVNILGLTFKEDCPDLRNSKVADVIAELREFGCAVHVHDPLAANADAQHEYGVELCTWEQLPRAQALIVAVAHQQYRQMPLAQLLEKLQPGGVLADVKSVLDAQALKAHKVVVWRL